MAQRLGVDPESDVYAVALVEGDFGGDGSGRSRGKGGRVPQLDLEAPDAGEVVAAVRAGGVGLEAVDKVLPDLFDLGVPLGVDENAETLLLVPHVEDLAAELPVDLCQAGLAEVELAHGVIWVLGAGHVVNYHCVDLDAELSWQGKEVHLILRAVSTGSDLMGTGES